MTSSTQAQDTSARLHDATRDGLSLLIPGAFEPRIGRPHAAGATRPAAIVPEATPTAPDRGRLEREREGGGAPSARRGSRHSILGKLWRWALKPTDGAIPPHHPLPQDG